MEQLSKLFLSEGIKSYGVHMVTTLCIKRGRSISTLTPIVPPALMPITLRLLACRESSHVYRYFIFLLYILLLSAHLNA